MFAPRVGLFAGYHFTENVTVQQAVELRAAIEAMPPIAPPRNLLSPSDPDSAYATTSPPPPR
jgi:hypothetical protein